MFTECLGGGCRRGDRVDRCAVIRLGADSRRRLRQAAHVFEEVVRQVVVGDQRLAGGHHGGGAQHVRQLAQVAGPVVGLEVLDHAVAQPRRATRALGQQQTLRQRHQVAALTQGGQAHGQAVEPVVEVFAEGMLLDHLAQIAVGGADHRDIDTDRLVAAQRRDLALLQHPQQARLQRQRHVADLVEKQRATVGLQDAPGCALAARTGDRSFFAAEQFGLDQVLRDGSEIDPDEGVARTR